MIDERRLRSVAASTDFHMVSRTNCVCAVTADRRHCWVCKATIVWPHYEGCPYGTNTWELICGACGDAIMTMRALA